jgi:glycosyltransferase involved in cell wall biosynthesis
VTRALFVTKHLRVGGAQRCWAILLPALADRGFETRLVTLEDEGEFFDEVRERGVQASCAGMRGRLDLPALRGLTALAEWRADVVVSHDERSHVVARVLAKRAGAPHVASDHGGPGFRLKPHRGLILRLVAPGFAAAVTISEQRVPDLLRYGFRRERIHVVPNGVDALALRPSRRRDALRSELRLPEDAFVALLPAVLRPEKRADRFVHAVSRANAIEPRIRGLVAGYGPEEAAVRLLATQAGGAVSVLGHRGDVPDLVAAADVVCLTSDVEGGPFAALEAMALAKPVAAMRAGALAEVVADGETGILVPPADVDGLAAALVSLARDPARAAALGAAGAVRQQAHFDADRMCDAHALLFRALCAARSSTSTSAGTATSVE